MPIPRQVGSRRGAVVDGEDADPRRSLLRGQDGVALVDIISPRELPAVYLYTDPCVEAESTAAFSRRGNENHQKYRGNSSPFWNSSTHAETVQTRPSAVLECAGDRKSVQSSALRRALLAYVCTNICWRRGSWCSRGTDKRTTPFRAGFCRRRRYCRWLSSAEENRLHCLSFRAEPSSHTERQGAPPR